MTRRLPTDDVSAPAAVTGGTPCLPADLPGFLPPARPEGRVFCSDLNIRIDRDGVWHYDGSPIARKELVCLFASILTRDSAGRYWLVTPAEIGPVRVDDAPFLGVELFASGSGEDLILSVRTNIDEVVTIDEDHPLSVTFDPETGEPSPYLGVNRGLTARLNRPVYYDLVDHGVEHVVHGRRLFGVWSCHRFFALGPLDGAP